MSKTWADALNDRFTIRPGWGKFHDEEGTVYCYSNLTLPDEYPHYMPYLHIIVIGERFCRAKGDIDEIGNPMAPKVQWSYWSPDGNAKFYSTFIEAMQAAEAAYPELFKEKK